MWRSRQRAVDDVEAVEAAPLMRGEESTALRGYRCLGRRCCALFFVLVLLSLTGARLVAFSAEENGKAWPLARGARIERIEEVARNATRLALKAEARATEAEAASAALTAQLAANTASMEANTASMEKEIDQIRKDSYQNEPDLQLRDELVVLEARVGRLGARLNASIDAERGDARDQTSALTRAQQEGKKYADARIAAAEQRGTAANEELSVALGEYKATTETAFNAEKDLIYHWIAGTFNLLTFLIALTGVYSHTRKFRRPEIQRKILAVLWMPPIYSLCCWLSLLYPSAAAGLGMIRDGYEAYTIWVFVSFLFSVIGDDGEDEDTPSTAASRGRDSYSRVVAKLAAGAAEHPLPAAFCPPCQRSSTARTFLQQCTVATLQFVLLKPLLSIAAYVLDASTASRNGPSVRWAASARLTIVVLQNISVTIAISGLLKVFHGVEHHMQAHSPWPKFCCVKGVVFVTYWQGITIWALSKSGTAPAFTPEMAETAQNFLICIEMFIASVVHSYNFSADEWQPGFKAPIVKVSDNLAVSDFFRDVRYVLKFRAKHESAFFPHTRDFSFFLGK